MIPAARRGRGRCQKRRSARSIQSFQVASPVGCRSLRVRAFVDCTSIEELICHSCEAQIPSFVAARLDSWLEERDEDLIWPPRVEERIDPASEMLCHVKTWIAGADEMQMGNASLTLKAIRRVGDRYPATFGAGSQRFVQAIQDDICQRFCYELDLLEHGTSLSNDVTLSYIFAYRLTCENTRLALLVSQPQRAQTNRRRPRS